MTTSTRDTTAASLMGLREEHLQVREMTRRFADEVVAPRARDLDERGEFPTDLVRKMAELGLLGLPYPEKYGGAGLDTLAYSIAVEGVSRVCGSTASRSPPTCRWAAARWPRTAPRTELGS